MALLSEDEPQVRRLLSDGAQVKACMLERSLEGETPLHVAASWPTGLELLFEFSRGSAQSLINLSDARASTPLQYARCLDSHEAVKILLENGADMDLELPFDLSYRFSLGTNQRCGYKQSAEVMYVLCHELAQRRRELYGLAMQHLPRAELQRLKLGDSGMVQENAHEVVQALGPQLSKWSHHFNHVNPGSLYHHAAIGVRLAKTLLSVGFDELNSLYHGYSPLMALNAHLGFSWYELHNYVELAEFFVDHGNDLYAQYPRSACKGNELVSKDPWFRAVHHMAYNLGVCVRECNFEWLPSLRSLFVTLMSEATTDPCECFCTTKGSMGCTPASLYVRGILDVDGTNTWTDVRPVPHLHMGIGFVSMALQASEVDVGKKIAMTFIRSCTFSRLGMKHTCCKYRYNYPHTKWPSLSCFDQSPYGGTVARDILAGTFHPIEMMEPDDMAEIWDEDAHLAAQLERLMAEFESRYDDEEWGTGIPFDVFFYDHWWKKMDEVEAERDVLSEREREAFREIGVVIVEDF